MKWRRNDRGQLMEAFSVFLAGMAVIGAVVGTGWLYDKSMESEALRRQAAADALAARKAQVPPANVDIFPMPNAYEPQQCVKDVIARNELGLEWTGNGWRAPLNYPYPEPTGDVEKDKAAVANWRYGIEGYIKQNAFKWESCAHERLPQAQQQPQQQQPANWSGSYAVTPHSKSNECLGFSPATLSVAHNGASVTIKFPYANGQFSVTGAVESDGSFSTQGTETVGEGSLAERYNTSLRGRFDQFDKTRMIRSGVLEITDEAGQTCTVGFEATA